MSARLPARFDPRRRTLRWLAAAAFVPFFLVVARLAPAQGNRLAPTPQDAEGPFYPRSFPADADNDLMRVAGRPSIAQRQIRHTPTIGSPG